MQAQCRCCHARKYQLERGKRQDAALPSGHAPCTKPNTIKPAEYYTSAMCSTPYSQSLQPADTISCRRLQNSSDHALLAGRQTHNHSNRLLLYHQLLTCMLPQPHTSLPFLLTAPYHRQRLEMQIQLPASITQRYAVTSASRVGDIVTRKSAASAQQQLSAGSRPEPAC
jgi:hypothetical protein